MSAPELPISRTRVRHALDQIGAHNARPQPRTLSGMPDTEPKGAAVLVITVPPDATDEEIEALADQFMAGLQKRREDPGR